MDTERVGLRSVIGGMLNPYPAPSLASFRSQLRGPLLRQAPAQPRLKEILPPSLKEEHGSPFLAWSICKFSNNCQELTSLILLINQNDELFR